MSKRKFSIAALVVLLAAGTLGCAPSLRPIAPPSFTVLKNYEGFPVQTATVGEPVFRVQQARVVPTYVATREVVAPGRRVIVPGEQFVILYMDAQRNRYIRSARDILSGSSFWVVVDSANTKVGTLPGGARSVRWVEEGSGSPFRIVREAESQPGAFSAEMIYSGMAGSVVRMAYREYVNDLARPAFSQELQYDLTADSVIAYKSIRIRVLEATNSGVRYRVEDDGGLRHPRAPALGPLVQSSSAAHPPQR